MNGNHNMVQKPKDEENYIEDEDEEVEEEESNDSSSNKSLINSDVKQKMINCLNHVLKQKV